MTPEEARRRLAFALDYPTLDAARAGAEVVGPHVGVLKVGLELFIQAGPEAVKMAASTGAEVFLDLKLHDISKTVERAVGTASQLGARYLTIHACGGPQMIELASKRAEAEGTGLKILAVTVLTSLDDKDLAATGVESDATTQVQRLAKLAVSSGAHGLVCSAHEVGTLRSTLGDSPLLVTPGIRPRGAAVGDQKRVGSPTEALRDGSSILVVGRPIRDADSPEAAAKALVAEMAAV